MSVTGAEQEKMTVDPDDGSGAEKFNCGICGGVAGQVWPAREMMFGRRDTFSYFECGECGCVQLMGSPSDLSRYYGSEYYSLSPLARAGGIRGWLRGRRNRWLFTGDGMVGRLLDPLTRYPYRAVTPWLREHPMGTDARVLDVGCGAGLLIDDLARAGYPQPVGIDPYVAQDDHRDSGATVIRGTVDDLFGSFDFVILNHVLEHLPEQTSALAAIRRVMAAGSACLVRTPTASSYSWRHYRSNWVQLDPPRHLFIHSLDSLARVAMAAGFEVAEIRFDSDEFQFVGSERYARDVPGMAAPDIFSRSEIREFRRRADRLNHDGEGDQIAALLRPV